MRTTLTAALGILLGVLPLHLDIKGRTANYAFRLRSYRQWRPATRHSKILLLEVPLPRMRTDFIPQCIHFEMDRTLSIPSREE